MSRLRRHDLRERDRPGLGTIIAVGALLGIAGVAAARRTGSGSAASAASPSGGAPAGPEEPAAAATPDSPRPRLSVRRPFALAALATVLVAAGFGFSSGSSGAVADQPAYDPVALARASAARARASARAALADAARQARATARARAARRRAEAKSRALLRRLARATTALRDLEIDPRAVFRSRRLASLDGIAPPNASERAIALERYVNAVGSGALLDGLNAERWQLQQKVLSDPRVHLSSGGRGDVASGRVDVRVLALVEYLAEANGEVTVSCLIAGHSRYVRQTPEQIRLKAPKVVSAHVYGRAVDVSAVGGVAIAGHQERGGVTEQAIRQILALPQDVLPRQVISLLGLGGPSFPLPDHYDHIHVGY